MTTITFSPAQIAYLRVNGYIYTLCKDKYSTSNVGVDGVGICKRVFVMEGRKQADFMECLLGKFIPPDSKCWFSVLRDCTRLNKPMYLYRVEIMDDHPSDVE